MPFLKSKDKSCLQIIYILFKLSYEYILAKDRMEPCFPQIKCKYALPTWHIALTVNTELQI